jgi:hypothetical protein
MTSVKWAQLRKAFYALLPFAQYFLVYYGVAPTDAAEMWIGAVSIIGSGVFSFIAIENVDMDAAEERDARRANVSRETLQDPDYIERTTPDVSRETSLESVPAPCAYLHGTAESHVLGCEGWRNDAQ